MQSLASCMIRASQDVAYGDDGSDVLLDTTVGDIRALLKLAHEKFDWQPLATAPKDGSTFLVFTEESGTYDFAEYSEKYGEFVKHGCGWDYASHWAAIN